MRRLNLSESGFELVVLLLYSEASNGGEALREEGFADGGLNYWICRDGHAPVGESLAVFIDHDFHVLHSLQLGLLAQRPVFLLHIFQPPPLASPLLAQILHLLPQALNYALLPADFSLLLALPFRELPDVILGAQHFEVLHEEEFIEGLGDILRWGEVSLQLGLIIHDLVRFLLQNCLEPLHLLELPFLHPQSLAIVPQLHLHLQVTIKLLFQLFVALGQSAVLVDQLVPFHLVPIHFFSQGVDNLGL